MSSSSSSGDGDEEGPLPPQARRSILRSATLILPKTGERVRRIVTLREPSEDDRYIYERPSEVTSDAEDDGTATATPRTPLLSHRATPNGVGRAKGKRRSFHRRSHQTLQKVHDLVTSSVGIGVLKCSIAYVLGSMATFVPILSNFLGDSFGKHMVATVIVYFHPARSLGSMFKAVVCAAVAFVYALIISFTSMGVSVLFDDDLHMLKLGHAIVLIFFCGGGLGFVGWVKQRLGDPLVNVGCSLTSLAIITVLTREGAVQSAEFSPNKVTQVFKMIVMGVMASTFVNVAIKPVSARRDLRQNLIDTTDQLGDMLAGITRAFLAGSEEVEQTTFQTASDKYKKSSALMSKNANEAKWEHYVLGTETQSKLEMKLVKSIQQMYQSLGGLRSAAATQFELLRQSAAGMTTPQPPPMIPSPYAGPEGGKSTIEEFVANEDNFGVLAAIAESSENNDPIAMPKVAQGSLTPESMPTAHAPSEIFERFIVHLGPSMKSLVYTLKQILDDLPCSPAPDYKIKVDHQFHSSLVKAIELYSEARQTALSLLYRSKDLAISRPRAAEADFEEVAASCGHFSYSLLNFAEEMKHYLSNLDELRDEVDKPAVNRTWNWTRIWRKGLFSKKKKPQRREIERSNVSFHAPSASLANSTELEAGTSLTFRLEESAPRNDFNYRLWKAGRFFRREDVRFAFKVGLGAAIYALPSFVPAWRPFYKLWRGEWGLLSYMLVCSMTIGAANTTSVARIFGTIVGALCAIGAWYASGGNVFVLATFGWLMSLWNFYLIVGMGQGPLGRFIMLTYNLSALYAYAVSVQNSPVDEEDSPGTPRMGQIALHRVVAVTSGCLWGVFITRIVWPISARRKFRDGLSLLLLRMGLIWKRDPLSFFFEGESHHSYLDLKEEFELRKYLGQLEGLCTAAASEHHLKSPWPQSTYSRVLKSVGHMLDSFHAMNVIILKDPVASEGERSLLKYTIRERAILCRMISHLFQVMASSVKLRFPLNDALPNTDGARDRLLAKVFNFRKDRNQQSGSNDEDFALLYAYALVTGQISNEIHDIARELELLYGTLDEESLSLE